MVLFSAGSKICPYRRLYARVNGNRAGVMSQYSTFAECWWTARTRRFSKIQSAGANWYAECWIL